MRAFVFEPRLAFASLLSVAAFSALYACGSREDLYELPVSAAFDASIDVARRVDASGTDSASKQDAAKDALADAPMDARSDAAVDASIDADLDGGASDAGLDAGSDGSVSLPPGTETAPVNQSTQSPTASGLELSTPATAPNPLGAFNGSGTGNKLFLGFTGWGGMSPLALADIKLRAKIDRGNASLYLNLQVDCDGDGVFDPAVDGIVAVDKGMAAGLALGPTFTDVTILATDPVFTIVGGGIFPAPPKCGLYSHLGNEGRPLTDLPPTALLWDGSTGDNGMPKNKAMPAVMWVLGDSANLADLAVTVESTSFGAKTYVFTP